jgi:hypothetical protein
MNHETQCQGTGVEFQDARGASVLASQPSMFDVGCSMLDVPDSSSTSAELQSHQAISDLIRVTKIFFGLDNECPSPADILSA